MEKEKEKNTFWNEKWAAIVDKDINQQEKYEISNFGRIRRFKKEVKDWVILKSQNVNGYKYFKNDADR